MKRYYVFGWSDYYPEGGMHDCILRTEDLNEALRTAVATRDDAYRGDNVVVWDVVEEKYIRLPEEDVKHIETDPGKPIGEVAVTRLTEHGFEADIRVDPGIDVGIVVDGLYVPPHGLHAVRGGMKFPRPKWVDQMEKED